MDEKQLRELITIIGQLGVGRMAAKFLGGSGRAPAADSDSKPLGLRRFLPWNRGTAEDDEPKQSKYVTDRSVDSETAAARRVDDIIKSVLSAHDDKTQPRSQSPADLKDVLSGAIERQDGVTGGRKPPVVQPAVPGVEPTRPAARSGGPKKEPSRISTMVDSLQLALDAVGVVEPTPFADGANAAISLGRAFITDPDRRKEHLQNAAISAAGMIPYVGDVAKVAKIPRAAKTARRASQVVRGTDRAADAAKATTAAEKRAARDRYRDTAQQVTSAVIPDDSRDGMEQTAAGSGLPAGNGGGSGGGVPPTAVGPPSPDDPRDNINRRRDEAEGIAEHDAWTDKLKAAGNKVAEFGGTLGKAVVKAAAFVKTIELTNTGVLALNRGLADYNGTLATSYAKADAADIRRDIRKGEALSGSLSGLNAEQSKLKDNLQEVTLPLQRIGIELLTVVTRGLNGVVQTGEFLIKVIENINPTLARAVSDVRESMKERMDSGAAWNQFFSDISDGKHDGKRPTFLGGKPQILSDKDHKDVFDT